MFGQVVIGPPGSGKTTYCHGMSEFLSAFGREVAVVNLDPANDHLPYKCDVDISTLITLSDVMDATKLGPNGGLIYCMEYLEKNIDWLQSELTKQKGKYLLFDFPGQLELPHVNVLSKCDLIEKFGKLSFNLDFYTDVLDLGYLLDELEGDKSLQRYKKLNSALVELVQDYSLVSFVPLNVEDKESMLRVMRQVDKANGYVFGDLEERDIQSMMSCAVQAEFEYEKIKDVREKYMDTETGDIDMDN
uniref:GPN-loop GTPase 2 n=1 Tax=Magallana gigas TaxID=29159 RepID=K1QV28_MAGGI